MSGLPEDKVTFADERAAEASMAKHAAARPRTDVSTGARPRIYGGGRNAAGRPRSTKCCPAKPITPAASQIRGATLVVAHLAYADLRIPEKDGNTKRDIKSTPDKPNDEPANYET